MRSKVLPAVVSMAICFSIVVGACSSKLPPETLPASVPTTSETIIETETVPSETTVETEAEFGPLSTPQVLDVPVELYGQLRVEGTNLVSESGEPVQLRGMSSGGLQSCFQFFNDDVCDTLIQDWGCTVIRLAMTSHGLDNGYTYFPDRYFNEVCGYLDTLIAHGVYVIVDWHILFDGDPTEYQEDAIDFFSRISALYGDYPNIIYEVCNEPNGMRYDDPDSPVDWDNVIKPYAETVIAAIRENDPDNIIIVGTPSWSQDVDEASLNPIDAENIMYTLHFYAGSHGQDHMDKVQTALDNGLPIFCTEWGVSMDSGNSGVFYTETLEWMDFLAENNISWCNWSIGTAILESSNALRLYSNNFTIEQKIQGHWPDEMISDSGLFVRSLILGTDFEIPEGGYSA
ncbi:MAG: glycoside hydrolase family 5 protein [Clostridiales bacterium]|nr:glycoside hydrolase family 5 protein [Clostridiales bacterium]